MHGQITQDVKTHGNVTQLHSMKELYGKLLWKVLVLTEDLDSDHMLSLAVAIFSYQLVVSFVLSDGNWNSYLCLYRCPVHLKIRNK